MNRKCFYRSLLCCTILLAVITAFSSCSKKQPEVQKTRENTEMENIIVPQGIVPQGIAPQPVTERSINKNVYLENKNVGGMKETQAITEIKLMASKIDIVPKNPVLDKRTWELESGEKSGKKVNVEKTLNALLTAKEGKKVKLVVEKIKPSTRASRVKKNIVRIAGFSTPLVDNQNTRVNNIQIAAEKIDYMKLAPGEEFSFNRIVGRRTEAKGYEEAPIIIKTPNGPKKGKGVGGGICQLSTTLYNAAEKSGMEITERHEHSKDVNYVPNGMDATVSYGSVDLKFVNSRKNTVMIRTYVSNGKLTVRIYENRN